MPEKMKLNSEELRALKDLESAMQTMTLARKKYPYLSRWVYVKQGCEDEDHPNYKNSGKYHVKCKITPEDMKFMWQRDGVDDMINAVFTRLDLELHFTLDNCKFMPRKEYNQFKFQRARERAVARSAE